MDKHGEQRQAVTQKAITKKKVIKKEIPTRSYRVDAGKYKCYMDYQCITSTGSPQYQLQQQAYTDNQGLRKVNEYYCIALGSAYGSEIGAKYIITLSTGKKFKAILADQKADCDTNEANTMDSNGAVTEFIVDTPCLPETVKTMGDISYCNGFNGKIVSIRKEKR